MVIPKIVEILETVEFVMPYRYRTCLEQAVWYRNYDSKPEQTNKQSKQNIAFFRNLRYR
jgi:hypothetical protein